MTSKKGATIVSGLEDFARIIENFTKKDWSLEYITQCNSLTLFANNYSFFIFLNLVIRVNKAKTLNLKLIISINFPCLWTHNKSRVQKLLQLLY